MVFEAFTPVRDNSSQLVGVSAIRASVRVILILVDELLELGAAIGAILIRNFVKGESSGFAT